MLDEAGESSGGGDQHGHQRPQALKRRERLLAQLAAERAKLQSLIMQTPAAVAVYEAPDFGYALVNEAFRKGLAGRDFNGQTTVPVPPDLRERNIASLREALRTGRPVTEKERLTQINSADGRVEDHYFTSSFQPVREHDGQVKSVIAVGLEVTDQVRAVKRWRRRYASPSSSSASWATTYATRSARFRWPRRYSVARWRAPPITSLSNESCRARRA